MLAGDAPTFQWLPIPRWAEAGRDGGGSREQRAATVRLQSVFGVFKAQPMAAGQVGAVDGQTHVIGRLPFEDRFFDVALVKVTGALAAYGGSAEHAALRNRQAHVHQ